MLISTTLIFKHSIHIQHFYFLDYFLNTSSFSPHDFRNYQLYPGFPPLFIPPCLFCDDSSLSPGFFISKLYLTVTIRCYITDIKNFTITVTKSSWVWTQGCVCFFCLTWLHITHIFTHFHKKGSPYPARFH